MLKNAPTPPILAVRNVHTAENEPCEVPALRGQTPQAAPVMFAISRYLRLCTVLMTIENDATSLQF